MTQHAGSLDGRSGGDRDRFDRQFRAAYRVLWLIAAGVSGNRDRAEDIIQEAALIAYGKFDQFEEGTNFAAWMGQTVRNVAMNTARKEHRRRATSIGESGVPDVPNPETRTASPVDGQSGRLAEQQSHFDDAVVRALNELSDTARACLLLKSVEGLDYSEISRVLDIPQGTAMSHVHRSRKVLEQRLADYRGPAGDARGARHAT